jgi:hypothetical protein
MDLISQTQKKPATKQAFKLLICKRYLVEPSGIEPLTSTLPATRVQKLKLLIYLIKTNKPRVFKSVFWGLFLTNRTKTNLNLEH